MVFGLKKTIAHIAGNMSLSTPSNGDSYLGNAIGEDHRPRSPPFFPAYDQGTRNEPYKRHPYDATEIDNSPLKDTRHRYEIHTPDTSPPRDIRPPTQELDVGNRGSRPSTRETDRGSRPSTGEADRNRRHSTTHTQETHSNRKTTHPAYIWDYEDNGHGDPRDKQIKDLEARIKKMDSLVAKAKDDQDQLSIVRNERDSLRKRVLSYDTRYNKVTKERDDLQKKVDSLSRVTKERDDLQKRVETFKGVIKERDDFRGRCDAFGIKFAKACSERDDWQKKYNGKIAKAVTERTEAYREKCNAMLRERNAAHSEEIASLKKENAEMRKHAETYYKRFTDLEGKQGELVKNYDEMQALVEKQKVNINELTVSISRSVNTSGTTTRDDDYFEREFASLAGAIHQWVIRYFRGISVVKHQELPQDILEFLGIGVPGYKMLPGSALNIKQIEAAFADRLCSNVFVPAFLFTIQGKLYDFGDFCGPLAGTDLKKREWYAQTVGMFFANEKYDGHLNHNARCVEKDLQEFSGFLAKGENEEQRHTTLPEIIEQAVKLQRETFQQVSLFQLHKIMPGDPYDPIIMEDVSGVVDEDEDEDDEDEDEDEDEEIMDKDEADGKEKRKEKGTRSFVVRTTIFAPVFRWGFDDDGMFSKTPVVVRKGAVIAIRATSTVLHIEDPNVRTARSPVLAHAQAENRYHDQQIWWIEPLVNTEDSSGRKGVVYSITNPPSGKAFEVTGSGSFSANQQSGGPSQWWKFQRIEQPDEGVCYHIVTARNHPISINGKDSRLGLGSHDPPGSDEYCWELVIPAVGYPPGWIQIQNVNTRDILSHVYIYDPPVLLPCPDSPRPSQYREEWQFQWTIVQWGSLESTTNAGSNLWGIKNRLTGAFLLSKSWDIPGARFCRVNAWKTADSEEYGSAWKLELDRLCHWKIVNLATGFLLQQTNIPYSGGVQVECVDKSFSLKDGTKSWILRPPILETGDEASTDLVKQDSSTSLSQVFLSLFPSLCYML